MADEHMEDLERRQVEAREKTGAEQSPREPADREEDRTDAEVGADGPTNGSD